jgi:hypothetical protein
MDNPKQRIVADAGETTLTLSYGEGTWGDLADTGLALVSGRMERVAFLPFGTQQGNPTVEVLVRTRGGLLVHANTTWALWDTATTAMHEWRKGH